MKLDTQRIEEALRQYYRMKLRGSESIRVSDVEQMTGGISHGMYSFHLEDVDKAKRHSMDLILRMGNDEQALNKEFRALEKLNSTSIPVPKVYDMGTDMLSSVFMIMEKVEGQNVVQRRAAGMTESELGELWQQYAKILADIHMLDWEGTGFGFLNPPVGEFGFVDRLLSAAWEGLKHVESSDLTPVLDWLDEHKPPSDHHVLLHGDYHINNVLVQNGELVAVVDWELASIGDAAFDVAEVPLILKLVHIPSEQFDHLVGTFLEHYQNTTERELMNLDYYQILKATQFLFVYLLATDVDEELREETLGICARQIEEMTGLGLPPSLTGR